MNIETYARRHPKHKPGLLFPETIALIEKLPEGARLLDVGCAEGSTILSLRQQWPSKFTLIGVDLSLIRIRKAADKNIDRSWFQVGDAQKLPMRDSSVDFAITSQVIEHVPDETRMLRELHRVLVSGARFQVDTVYKKSWARYFYRAPVGWALDPTHLREYTDIDAFTSKFPPGLIIQEIRLLPCYRPLNILAPLSFLPNRVGVIIPGYFTLLALGHKQ